MNNYPHFFFFVAVNNSIIISCRKLYFLTIKSTSRQNELPNLLGTQVTTSDNFVALEKFLLNSLVKLVTFATTKFLIITKLITTIFRLSKLGYLSVKRIKRKLNTSGISMVKPLHDLILMRKSRI